MKFGFYICIDTCESVAYEKLSRLSECNAFLSKGTDLGFLVSSFCVWLCSGDDDQQPAQGNSLPKRDPESLSTF